MKLKLSELKNRRQLTRTNHDENGLPFQETLEFESNMEIEYANIGHRIIHHIIDKIVIFLLFISSWFLFLRICDLLYLNIDFLITEQTIILYYLIVYFIYYFVLEFLFQITIGKLFFGNIVIDEYGNKPKFYSIVIRTLLRLLPFNAFSCFSSIPWHDEYSKTNVISKKYLSEILLLQEVLNMGN